jgi:low temperature requirement protein LtrA
MAEPTDHAPAPERIEWLELFFDLVVVAAVAVLSDALRDDATWGGLGIFLVTYGAVWLAWVSVVMYADVAAELTRVRTVVVSMFLLAVMAAASPGHAGHRADAFAGAFLLVRVFAARGALRTGRMMTAWPALQFGSFTVPWVVSLFVDVPWKYVLWGAAVAAELVLVMLRGEREAERAMASFQEHMDRAREQELERASSRRPREVPELRVVGVDREHLDERLGLFVIIVLGEAVAALVLTAARSEWDRGFVGASVAAFVLLVLLWLLTFSYGFASAPGVRLGDLAPRVGLPLHLLTTTGILLLAVGLGEVVAASGEHLHGLILWLTCGGLALHALASGLAGLIGGTGRFWLWTCALPTVVFPLLVAGVATVLEDGLRNPLLIWLLALPLLWQFLYAQRHSELLGLGRLGPATVGD